MLDDKDDDDDVELDASAAVEVVVDTLLEAVGVGEARFSNEAVEGDLLESKLEIDDSLKIGIVVCFIEPL